MNEQFDIIIDQARFAQARRVLGHNFCRVLGYFRDDCGKAMTNIENALRARNALMMIGPAEILKSEAIQMGALTVAELAEDIEMQARDYVEARETPEALLERVLQLRIAFDYTVAEFDRSANPLLMKKAMSGQHVMLNLSPHRV